MEWNVKNALSRDVEREHLNKILKEIRAAMDSSSDSSLTEAQIRSIVEEIVAANSSDDAGVTFTISLTGDVTGEGTVVNSNNVSIATTLVGDYVEEAPLDSNVYWRSGGAWAAVPGILRSLSVIEDEGILVYSQEDGWVLREIEGTAGNIVVTDGDGVGGNPVIDLAAVPDAGSAPDILKIVRDGYGRVVATELAEHNELSAIQGGATGEYYHFTDSEHTVLQDMAVNGVAAYIDLMLLPEVAI